MAGLRSNRALNRNNRGAAEHDIMEGLPVRQWRKQDVILGTRPPKDDTPANIDPHNRWRELPMPRGSEIYSPMSQALLRAARKGRITQSHQKPEEEDKDLIEEEKTAPEPEVGIATLKWVQISKDQEKPELEFLAKRRKGLPSIHGEGRGAQPMRKVKIKKVDAEGNASVFDVLAPEGAVVEGEIVKDAQVHTEAPAPGTVVEGVGIANSEGVVVAAVETVAPTPPRRGPPRHKRKAKGPGRGRKKKQMLSPGTMAGALASDTIDGTQDYNHTNEDMLKVPDASGDAASGSDMDIDNESVAKEGEDGSDEDGDEGDDREEGDISEMEAPTRSVSPMKQTHATEPRLDPISEVIMEQSSAKVEEQPPNTEATFTTIEPATDPPPMPLSTDVPAFMDTSEIVEEPAQPSPSDALPAVVTAPTSATNPAPTSPVNLPVASVVTEPEPLFIPLETHSLAEAAEPTSQLEAPADVVLPTIEPPTAQIPDAKAISTGAPPVEAGFLSHDPLNEVPPVEVPPVVQETPANAVEVAHEVSAEAEPLPAEAANIPEAAEAPLPPPQPIEPPFEAASFPSAHAAPDAPPAESSIVQPPVEAVTKAANETAAAEPHEAATKDATE